MSLDTWLKTNIPDIALVDVKLADGSCLELAQELKTRGVPTAFLSAWGKQVYSDVRSVMPSAWLEKPASEAVILRTLRQLGAGVQTRA